MFICLLSFLAVVIRSQAKDTNSIASWDFDHLQDKNEVNSVGGKQFLVMINQIEISSQEAVGEDESSIHSPEEASAVKGICGKGIAGCTNYMNFQLACT